MANIRLQAPVAPYSFAESVLERNIQCVHMSMSEPAFIWDLLECWSPTICRRLALLDAKHLDVPSTRLSTSGKERVYPKSSICLCIDLTRTHTSVSGAPETLTE